LVLALVCRIASRSTLSGIFTVVFMKTFSLKLESLSTWHNGNEGSDFIVNGIRLRPTDFAGSATPDPLRNRGTWSRGSAIHEALYWRRVSCARVLRPLSFNSETVMIAVSPKTSRGKSKRWAPKLKWPNPPRRRCWIIRKAATLHPPEECCDKHHS